MTVSKTSSMSRRRFAAAGLLAAGASTKLMHGTGIAAQSTAGPNATPGGTRTVEHALGTTEVPANPQRVVTLDKLSLETMLALGLTPIGTVDGSLEPYEGLIDVDLSGIVNIGGEAEPDLEQILTLNPDLIFGEGTPGEGIDQIYGRLSRIAPTVAFIGGPEAGYEQGWKDTFLSYAGLLNRGSEAEQLLRDYETRARTFGETFRVTTGTPPEETTVSVIRFRTDMIRAYVASSFAGSVIEEAGLSRPEGQRVKLPPSEAPWVGLSIERLSEIDADHIFIFQTFGDFEEGSTEIPGDARSNPLWETLSAVQAGNVHAVSNGELWFEGTVIAAGLILSDLENALLRQQSRRRPERSERA